MTPGFENGVMVAPLADGETIAGFYVEGGNDGILDKYISENFKREVSQLTYEQAAEHLTPVKDAIEAKGYVVGPFETKTHKEWCVDVLGADPDEYDRNEQQESEAQSAFDEEYNDKIKPK
jgi:hypothetical protein